MSTVGKVRCSPLGHNGTDYGPDYQFEDKHLVALGPDGSFSVTEALHDKFNPGPAVIAFQGRVDTANKNAAGTFSVRTQHCDSGTYSWHASVLAVGTPRMSLHLTGVFKGEANGVADCHSKDPVINGTLSNPDKSGGADFALVVVKVDPSASLISLDFGAIKGVLIYAAGSVRTEIVGEGLSRSGTFHADIQRVDSVNGKDLGYPPQHLDGSFSCAGVEAR